MSDHNQDGGPHGDTRVAQRVAGQLEPLLSQGLAPGLHIIATPIGNLGDITLRALAALASADRVLCEDTRRARKLLSHYGISRELGVYEEHRAERIRPRVLGWLRAGESVGLISDAGTPLISDPGFKLVRDALAEDIPVFTAPGPVAAIAALTISGLPTDSFFFAGFLPAKSAGRKKRLSELAAIEATLIFYESPSRVTAVLSDISEMLGERTVAIMREVTKRFETRYQGTARALCQEFEGKGLKGELVLMVEAPAGSEITDAMIVRHVEQAMQTMSPRDAVRWVADVLDVQRKRVYNLMVEHGRSSQ